MWLIVVLRGASLQAQDSPGGSGCGVEVPDQVQLLAVKVQWLRWGLLVAPCLFQVVSAKLLAALGAEMLSNDRCVNGQPSQMKAQGFRMSVMGNSNEEDPDEEGEFTQPTAI